MKYITFNGDEARTYKADYNTNKFSEEALENLCKTWKEEDNDGTDYYLADDGEQMIHFTNLDISIVSTKNAEEERLEKIISEEFSGDAVRVGEEFYCKLKKIVADLKNPAFSGTAVEKAMRETPRVSWLKNYDSNCDIQVDLLLHTFRKVSH